MNGNPRDVKLVLFFGHDDIHCPKRVIADLRKQGGTSNDGFQTFQWKAFCGPHVSKQGLGDNHSLPKCVTGLGQHMSQVEYLTILKYRLMIPLFLVEAIFPVCRKACLDSFRKHVVHCKEFSGFKYRHNMVKDVLFYVCRRVGISAKKEAPVNFLIDPLDGRHILRPADVLIFG
uniref:Putative reverse transcriptase domain-containing protein n=1 Tax=Tanacetum cinerariifolium TaxID=118510 RepID=A0A699GGS8_TANCI|nr:putative reverse transcriptase domain-containing protein [Tanacetum cinerariifolium]